MYHIYRALTNNEPVTRKLVHADGNIETHRLLDVPIGTPVTDLLEAAGRDNGRIHDDEVVLDGGPGWCFKAESALSAFSVTKRTNCILLFEETAVAEHTLGEGRIQLLDARDWTAGPLETEPTARLTPRSVRISLVTNPSFEGIVSPSDPVVEVGDDVNAGDPIATPADGISIPQHASVSGTVTAVENAHIEIETEHSDDDTASY